MDAASGSEEFIATIVGRYTNKKQAQSDPTGFSWKWIEWIDLGNSSLQSRQWDHHTKDVYRERNFIVENQNSNVLLVNHDINWNSQECDILWIPTKDGWKSEGKCHFGKMDIYYTGYLTKKQYRTWDRGFQNGKQIIGNSQSEFIFDKQGL